MREGNLEAPTRHPVDWKNPLFYDEADAITGVRALLRLMGEDPDREGLQDTPARVVKAYRELAARPGDPAQLLGRVFTDTD